MHVEWYGQSAFRLTDGETTVAIDPFGDMSGASVKWGYLAISVDADVLMVTHEHRDHNGVEAVAGSPVVVRSTAGRHETPIGDVVGVASEHDPERPAFEVDALPEGAGPLVVVPAAP